MFKDWVQLNQVSNFEIIAVVLDNKASKKIDSYSNYIQMLTFVAVTLVCNRPWCWDLV